MIGLLNVAKVGRGTFAPEETTRLEIVADELALGVSAGHWAAKTEETARQLRETQGRTVRTERLRAVGELASGVAHDFNNLLTAILGSAELLSREETDPHRLEELQTIQHAAQDGAETVRRILEYTRVRHNQDLVRVALPNVIREAVELTRGRWRNAVQARGVTIDVHLDLDVVRPVMGNPAELREMLTNLILNAVDAMPDGGRLTLGLREVPHGENASTVEMLVEDTGTGMAPEVLEHIFDPFFTTKEGTGAGLGLAVAYGIVARHQGETTVRSVPGQGTCFTIRLPVAADQVDRDGVNAPIDEMRPVGTRLASARRVQAARILVVDDEPKLAQLLQSFLELQGHRASTVTGGAEALALLGRESFDLLLTDLGMPGMSGWDLAREARRRQPDLPVILVSGWGAQIDPQHVAETGITEVIQKPYTFETVHKVIEAALRERNSSPLS
jgi:signal transduction histidine kinase/ActR/RegA family two-component response regulator